MSTGAGARFFLTAASVVVVLAGLRAAAPLAVPFLLAGFLALLSAPLVRILRLRGLPRWPAVLLTVLAVVAVFSVLFILVSSSFASFTARLPRYQVGLRQVIDDGVRALEARGVPAAEYISLDLIDPDAVLDLVGSTVRGVAAVLSNLFLVFIILVFALVEATALEGKLRAALGDRPDALARIDRVRSDVQRYLGVKTLVSLGTGMLIGGWVGLLGLDFPILWGLVAFLLNYVPTIGSIIAAVPACLLSLVQLGWAPTVVMALGYVAVNLAVGSLLEPTIMGRRFGLSTFVVFASLLFWGWVWGPVGALLSVPLTIIVKISLENTEDFRWLATLLGAAPPPSRPASP